MIFDFQRFSKCIQQAYEINRNSYDLEEVKEIFRYYFECYESVFGKPHPFISSSQIINIISIMEEVDDEKLNRTLYVEPETYKEMIDKYFMTAYKNCDYNINHFFSGKIRLIKLYEVGGI